MKLIRLIDTSFLLPLSPWSLFKTNPSTSWIPSPPFSPFPSLLPAFNSISYCPLVSNKKPCNCTSLPSPPSSSFSSFFFILLSLSSLPFHPPYSSFLFLLLSLPFPLSFPSFLFLLPICSLPPPYSSFLLSSPHMPPLLSFSLSLSLPFIPPSPSSPYSFLPSAPSCTAKETCKYLNPSSLPPTYPLFTLP